MSGKIIVIPSLSKLCKLKWLTHSRLFLVILTLSSLLLVRLSSVHGAKQAINILLDDGNKIRVTRNQIVSNTHFQVNGDGNKPHIHIGSIHIEIDRSKPLIQHIRSLRATPGVKSAILVRLSSDERCTDKIREFNKTFHSSLSFSEQIKLRRKLCSSLQKYQEQGARQAKRHLPIEQYQLGCTLANLADEFGEEVSFLREAVELLTQSAKAGFQAAKKTLPLVQNNLAVSLAYLAQGSEEGISLLREAVELLEHSANAGCQHAKINLPIEQCNLGIILAISAQNSPDKIPLLRESIHFLTESVNAGDTCARKYLPIAQYKLACTLANSAEESVEGVSFLRDAVKLLTQSLFGGYEQAGRKLSAMEYKLGCALTNSTQGSVDEIPLLREAMYLLESIINSSFQTPKNLPLIHATLEKTKKRLETLLTPPPSQEEATK
ncbi:MAG: hypothetical protein K2X28_05165 [Alphaproteobacteria bacterium]|nr:hypothetical protein [Alphaproteobacteria bacterium]